MNLSVLWLYDISVSVQKTGREGECQQNRRHKERFLLGEQRNDLADFVVGIGVDGSSKIVGPAWFMAGRKDRGKPLHLKLLTKRSNTYPHACRLP